MVGGLTGILLAIPPVDFIVHNSLFLVAHFHHVIIPGVVFAIIAGYTYWFPKAFGFTLDERLGKAVFWCWFIGFNLAFMPQLPARLLGRHAADAAYFRPELEAVAGGRAGRRLPHRRSALALTVCQLLYSIRTREQRRDLTGDPWDGRTLEWLTLSPPPHYNFAVLPDVHGEEAYWHRKQRAIERGPLIPEPDYQPIEMPVNTPTGVIVAFFASVCGFAIIWYIWWLAILGLIGAFAVFVWYAWRDEHEHIIPVEEVIANARERRRIRMEHLHKLSQSVMSTASEAPAVGLTHQASEDTGLGQRGPESKSIVVPYGFWLFVLSDMVLFSALFATYASLVHATDGGPTTNQLFHRELVAVETMALLLSSFVCGLAMITAKRANMAVDAGLAAADRPARPRFPVDRDLRVRGDGRRGRAAPAQRVPVGLLHPGRLPRRCTSPPACCGSER